MTKVVLYFVFLFAAIVPVLKADCDVASTTTASGTFYETREKLCSGDLIFEENFDDFDFRKWQHEITMAGGGNWEFEFYNNNRTNSYVENGNLHIKPSYLADERGENYLFTETMSCYGGAPADECTNPSDYGCQRQGTATNALNPITSARIRTVYSFSYKYGTLIVRAKLPAGDWLWPAIWLLPRDNYYGLWPASGEIDLLESRGNKNLVNAQGVYVGSQQISQTLHWAPYGSANQWARTHWEKNNDAGYDTDFHTYKMVWDPAGITFYIDDELTGTVPAPAAGFWNMGEFENSGMDNPWKRGTNMAPFDQEFYLLINLACGGINGYFADDCSNPGGKPWSNTSPTASTDFWLGKTQWEPTWNLGTDDSHLVVDYVQIYAI